MFVVLLLLGFGFVSYCNCVDLVCVTVVFLFFDLFGDIDLLSMSGLLICAISGLLVRVYMELVVTCDFVCLRIIGAP